MVVRLIRRVVIRLLSPELINSYKQALFDFILHEILIWVPFQVMGDLYFLTNP